MKIKRLNVVYDPLNIALTLRVIGGSLSQRHNADTGEYEPDRSLTPLVIKPILYVQDPSGIISSGNKSFSTFSWYLLPADVADSVVLDNFIAAELSNYLISSATEDYTVGLDGQLTVSENIKYLKPKTLVFVGTFADSRSGNAIKVAATALLSTLSVSEPASLTLDKPVSWEYDPLIDVGTRKITATLKIGGNACDGIYYNAYYFWYKRVNNVDTLLNEDDLFYVSGVNSSELEIDPRFLDPDVLLVCKADYLPVGMAAPAEPSDSAITVTTKCVRRYGEYDYSQIVNGGVEANPLAEYVKDEALVFTPKKVITDPQAYFSITWSVKYPTYDSQWEVLGYGNSCKIPMSRVSQGADIGLAVEELKPLKAIQDDNGNDLTINSSYLII